MHGFYLAIMEGSGTLKIISEQNFSFFNFVKCCGYPWKIFPHPYYSAAYDDSIWLCGDNKMHTWLPANIAGILLNNLINTNTWHMFHFIMITLLRVWMMKWTLKAQNKILVLVELPLSLRIPTSLNANLIGTLKVQNFLEESW